MQKNRTVTTEKIEFKQAYLYMAEYRKILLNQHHTATNLLDGSSIVWPARFTTASVDGGSPFSFTSSYHNKTIQQL